MSLELFESALLDAALEPSGDNATSSPVGLFAETSDSRAPDRPYQVRADGRQCRLIYEDVGGRHTVRAAEAAAWEEISRRSSDRRRRACEPQAASGRTAAPSTRIQPGTRDSHWRRTVATPREPEAVKMRVAEASDVDSVRRRRSPAFGCRAPHRGSGGHPEERMVARVARDRGGVERRGRSRVPADDSRTWCRGAFPAGVKRMTPSRFQALSRCSSAGRRA